MHAKRTTLSMKLSNIKYFLTLVIAVISLSFNIYPETKTLSITYKDGIISIQTDNAPLIELLTAITEKIGVKFIYDRNTLTGKNITIQLKDIPLQDAIKEILKKCDIKTYTTKLGESPDKPIEQIEILPTPTSSSGIEIPYREEEEPFYPEAETEPGIEEPEPIPEEKPVEDKSNEYRPPESSPIPEKDITTQEETPPEEEAEQETGIRIGGQTLGTRTYTRPSTTTLPATPGKGISTKPSTKIEDASDQYYPPGSERIKQKPEGTIHEGDTLPDMSDQYCPPGGEKIEKKPEATIYEGDTLPNMSDQYRPPG